MNFTVYVTNDGLVSLLRGELVQARLERVCTGRSYTTPVQVDQTWFVEAVNPYGNIESVRIRKPSWFRRIFG